MKYTIDSKKKYGITPEKHLFVLIIFFCAFVGYIYLRKFTSPFQTQPNPSNISPTPTATGNKASIDNTEIFRYRAFYLKGFETSVGIKTTINIYKASVDPENSVRVNISGIDYLGGEAVFENSNYTAFVESLDKAFEEIKNRGADPYSVDVLFYSEDGINYIAENWAYVAGYVGKETSP